MPGLSSECCDVIKFLDWWFCLKRSDPSQRSDRQADTFLMDWSWTKGPWENKISQRLVENSADGDIREKKKIKQWPKLYSWIFNRNQGWRITSRCFVFWLSCSKILFTGSDVPPTDPPPPLPAVGRRVLVQLIMTGEYWKTSNPVVSPALHDSLTWFPLSFVPHVSERRLLRILAAPPGPVFCPVALPAAHQTDR